MEHTHYLLQTWLAWWSNAGIPLISSAACSFEKNAGSAFWRDIGNLITGAGAGWAAVRDSFFHLFGADLPAHQPQSGGDAIRDTVGSFLHQIYDGLTGSGSGRSSSSPSAPSTSPESGYNQPPLSDLLPPEMGGRTTLADVVSAASQGKQGD